MHYEDYESRQIPDKNDCIQWARGILDAATKQQEMAEKFVRQLEQLLPAAPQDGYQYLNQRISAATTWFINAMDELEASIETHINEIKVKTKARKYVTALQQLRLLPQRKKSQLKQAIQITEGLIKGMSATDLLELIEEQKKAEEIQVVQVTEKITAKPQKGDSHRMSLQLYREGKNVAEIAKERQLAISTIEGHLASFISTGDIDIKELVAENKIPVILQAIEELNMQTAATTPVKEKLGSDFSHIEIRAVYYYRELIQNAESKTLNA